MASNEPSIDHTEYDHRDIEINQGAFNVKRALWGTPIGVSAVLLAASSREIESV